MCTVVCHWSSGPDVDILALRDEFVGREFDDPGQWWPEQPAAIGGRDRAAGGTWCASDAAAGITALLVNRTERFAGTPSRGLLPLAALAHGHEWPTVLDHRTMASFNLVLARPDGVTVWVWDSVSLQRHELTPGTHLITSSGVDAGDRKTQRFAHRFQDETWGDVVDGCAPSADESALIVRREYDGRTYATVFGQRIASRPGRLDVAQTRTPWVADSWRERVWTTDTQGKDEHSRSGTLAPARWPGGLET